MIDVILCIVLVICAAFCAYTFYKEKKKINKSMSFMESINLVQLPIVTFTTEKGTKLNFILDTGASQSAIDSRYIKNEIYESVEGQVQEVVGVEGIVKEDPIIVMMINYKNYPYYNKFCVSDLSGAFDYLKSYSGVLVHGLIGSDFLTRYEYVLDYKEMIAYAQK